MNRSMRYFLRLLPIVMLCVVCSSCVKEADEQFIPIRMSEPHADNTSISVIVNVHQGYMDMYGYTHYGVVCGTSEDVTKESGTIMDMRALGTFDGYYEASITGLNPGTTYYIRPYYSRFDALHHGDAVEVVTMGAQPEPQPEENWYLSGGFNGWITGDENYKMTLEGNWYVFKGLDLNSDDQFKFVGEDWNRNTGCMDPNCCIEGQIFGTGGNLITLSSGTYNVYLSHDATSAYFESVDYSWILDPDSEDNLWKNAKMDVSFWFSDNSWNQIADPEYSSTGNNYHKIVIPAGAGESQWQGQMVFNHTGIVVSPTKSYDFQIILNSTADHPHVTVKGCYEESSVLDAYGNPRDINPLINEERVVLTANQDMVLHYTGLQGSAIPDFKLVLDFAGAAAGSEVVIKDIVLRESSSQSASVPKDWYLTGKFNNWEVGDENYKMTLTGGWYVFKGLDLNSDDEFKFVGKDWSRSLGCLDDDCVEGQVFETTTDNYNTNISIPSGVYNVYLSHDATLAYFESVVSSYEDLSASGRANCYIVNKAGAYSFTPTKGHSYYGSVGTIANAEVLWESLGTDVTPSVGNLIRNVKYQNGIIRFETALAFREGNAVIAAKDASGQILWSWHIWLTDQPQGQEYCNNAGTMMDRNLGATSATPGDVGALGLLYQWGRKDPFLGSSSISDNIEAKSTITWPSAVSSNSTNGTIEYATAYPTTFITDNSSNYDWYYTGSSTTDNTRWTTSTATKSIYDPCPSGWRVPDGGGHGIWSRALGSSSAFNDPLLYDSTNEGMNFSGKFGSASTIWYPASGCRGSRDGGLYDVGINDISWSASPAGSNFVYGLGFSSNGVVNPSNAPYRAYGLSVRCMQDPWKNDVN